MKLHQRLAELPVDTWPGRGIAWAGCLFITTIVAFAGWDIRRGYQATVDETTRELMIQSRVIAEQTARSVQAVDVMLRHVAAEHRRGRLSRLSGDELHLYLRDISAGLKQIDGLGVFDAAGEQIGVSWPAPRRAVNMSRLPRFQQLRDDPTLDFVIFEAAPAAGDGAAIVPFGRRLEGADGGFAGVVAARGRVDYFEQFYRDAYPEPSTRVALLHRNGTLLARHPPQAAALGQRFPALEGLLPTPDGRPVASRGISPVDGVDRFAAIRLVPDYPLVVVVTREAEAALAPWRSQAIGSALRTLALGALAGLLLLLLWRQLSRLAAARASLEVSEQRYALAMTGSDEGHWLWDMPARQIYVSARLAELFGIAGGAQVLPDDDYFRALPLHPEDRERVHRNRDEHVAGLTPRLDHEFRIVQRASGEVRWIHTRAQCFRGADGQPLHMAGSTVDVTPRKRAEIALRISEQRFADAVAGSDDGIWEWDFTTGMAFGSKRGRLMLGLPPGPEVMPLEVSRAEVAAQLHPDDVARRATAIEDHLAGRTPAYVGDFRARQSDGSWRWVHIHGMCVRDADGKPLRMAGSASDIDDRKRAEEALRESEERYALAMTGSRGGHWVWDIGSDTLFVSDAVNELLGLPAGTLKHDSGLAYRDRVHWHPEDRARNDRIHADLIAGRVQRAEFESRVVRPDGTLRWVLTRAQRFERGGNGHGLRIAGVSVDVSERKQADAERERLEDQLRQAQKLEAIGTLAGGIAHDFNNILSAILGYGELAQKDAPAGSAQRRHIDAALAAGQRAKSLVERILAFSRSGMGERVPVHVQSVVDEALDAIAASLPAGVSLERRLVAGDAGVLADPTQIHQVVMNLCANAVQAMRAEGRLVVTLDALQLAAPLAVATSTLPAGDTLRLAVADTGSGIEPRLLERIFDPFFTTKEVGVGTGLGLSLVHGIVTDLGGGIDVQSRPGAGSTFAVYLPAHGVVRRNTAAVPANESAPRGNGQTVLLVDDEEPLVRLGEELLAGLGYEPIGYVSSRAALDALRAEPARFDAVLSDESMPGVTGRELAIEARRLRPDLPVVLMSGYLSAALLQGAREAGVVEVLAKPLAAGEIARALAAALRSRTT